MVTLKIMYYIENMFTTKLIVINFGNLYNFDYNYNNVLARDD